MAGADMCSVGHKSVLPNRNRQMTYMHRGNCRSSVCRSKGGRPVVVVVVVLAQVPSASLVSSPPRLAGPQVEEPPESRILIYNKILPKTKRAQGIATLNFIE